MVVGNDGEGAVGPVVLTGGKIFVCIEIGYPGRGFRYEELDNSKVEKVEE